MAAAVPDTELRFADGASPDTRDYRVDFSRIHDELGYETKWTAADGARELAAAYDRIAVTLEEFEGPRYQRIAHVRALLAEGRLDEQLRFRPDGATASGTGSPAAIGDR